MTDWVRFHSEIRRGAKKGIPRAERFVYMELSQEARANGGYITLPVDRQDLDAVCELLGGDREEVLEAVRRFTKGPDPSLIFEGPKHRRILRVVHWLKWNTRPEPSGASTPRSQKSRALKAAVKPRNQVAAEPRNGFPVTETLKPRTGEFGESMESTPKPRTTTANSGNAQATVPQRPSNGFQIRSETESEEKRSRGDPDPDPEDVVSYPNLNKKQELVGGPDPGPSVGVSSGDPVSQIYDHYLVGWRERNTHGGRPPGLTTLRRKLIEARLAEGCGVDDLKLACDGIWRSEWHVEKGYTLLEHIMRDREHVERFMQTPVSSRVQNSDGYTEADAKEAQARFLANAEKQNAERAAAGYKDPLA